LFKCLKESSPGKARKVYFDALRIIAAFFVIFNHTGTNGFFLFSLKEWGSPPFWLYLFVSIFCKVSVPLFFAISGALMLHRADEPISVLWKKRIGKILMIIVIFVVGNYVIDWCNFRETITLRKIFTTVYTGTSAGYSHWYGHLWYLYAYMAYLCCLPFLRSLVKNLDDRYFYYMITIALTVKGILPTAEYLLTERNMVLSGNAVPGWLLSDIVVYPCIGYFLEHRLTIRRQTLKWLWLANIASIAVTALLVYRQAMLTQVLNAEVSQGFHCIFVMVNCICLFATAKYLFTNHAFPSLLKKAILSLGQCTFGIYLIHIMILESEPLRNLLSRLLMHVNSMLACLIQCACVMAIGYAVTLILKRIPYLGKLLS